MFNKDHIELLAPAGSYEGFEAVLGAGADAVYAGGNLFGARAYAKNFDREELIQAIRTAHLHGRRLYLTVNTLVKNTEMQNHLYDYLAPFYDAGLDAVLVQDFGVLKFIKKYFPGLPIHASTQMAVTGPAGMKFLEKQGLSRIVPARELSLEEIRAMHKASPLEIEVFIHGALCYSYSGQCLMSSILGGRSGNRGRCAQPCRLSYKVSRDGKDFKGGKEYCPLSLKDISTIEILPKLLEAGAMSLKIEGRMKSREYAAGVAMIYRKYLDRIFQLKSSDQYRVDPKDQEFLLDLFNRGGSCKGYFEMHNGPSMMAFNNNKKTGEVSLSLNQAKKSLHAVFSLYTDCPASMTLEDGQTSVTLEGEKALPASGQPLTQERIRKSLLKLGGTPYIFDSLEVYTDEQSFLPVKFMNELRRDTLKVFEEAAVSKYNRKPGNLPVTGSLKSSEDQAAASASPALYASCETPEQIRACLEEKKLDGIYAPYDLLMQFTNGRDFSGTDWYLAFPHITRKEASRALKEELTGLLDQGLKGFLIRNLESLALLEEMDLLEYAVADHSLYTFNDAAVGFLKSDLGLLRITAPLELNEKELSHRDHRGGELLIYGYLPMMHSAQCIRKNCFACDHKAGRYYLKDRMDKIMTGRCYCNPWNMGNTDSGDRCYNIIYNSLPYSLSDEVSKYGFSSLRLSFTIENERQTKQVLTSLSKKADKVTFHPQGDFTRGHFKRGVE